MKFQPNKNHTLIRNSCIIFFLSPLFWLTYQYLTNGLMPNPFSVLSITLGHTCLILIASTLAISPCRFWMTQLFRVIGASWGRRISDWNYLVKLRRTIGVLAFIYGCLHMMSYLYFELDFMWKELLYEVTTRRFVGIGVIAYFILFILAMTSTNFARRRMGKWWVRLHQLNYLLGGLAVLHYWLSVKSTNNTPYLYLVVILLLLIHRIYFHFFNFSFRGDETKAER